MEDQDILFRGTPGGLDQLASYLTSPEERTTELLTTGERHGYEHELHDLLIQPGGGLAAFEVMANSRLVVRGDEDSRRLLGNAFQAFADKARSSEPWKELHLDPYPGHSFLHPSSFPLVLVSLSPQE
jgi:hypothetical protein